MIFSRDGAAAVEMGEHRWYADRAIEILGVVISAGVAPTGADLVADVVLEGFDGGGSVYVLESSQPRVVAGEFEGVTGPPDVVMVAQGQYLTVDIDQVGSVVAGSKIDVRILYR